MERCGMDDGARRGGLAACADDGVRIARRVVAKENVRSKPVANLSRAGRRADSLCEAAGLHAYRAAADHGASVRRVVGIPDSWILCGDAALRVAGGFYVFCGLLPSRRDRSFSGLDAGAFSTGCARVEFF